MDMLEESETIELVSVGTVDVSEVEDAVPVG